jgi:hypothetical protein
MRFADVVEAGLVLAVEDDRLQLLPRSAIARSPGTPPRMPDDLTGGPSRSRSPTTEMSATPDGSAAALLVQ